MQYFFLLCTFFCCANHLLAQPTRLNIVFEQSNGDSLAFALTGGLNNPQFSTLDLNGDSIEDLVYFDRQGSVFIPFLNQGTSQQVAYVFAPQYQPIFPNVERFALLRDYNCDGIKDLIAYHRNDATGEVGMSVHQGSRNSQNEFQFTLITPTIYFRESGQLGRSNLSVSTVDIPALNDIDNDGDLDILNFNGAGGYIEYFRNESQELGYGCDSLLFVLADDCWGRIYESGVTEVITLSDRIDSCANQPNWTPIRHARHAGSTLLTLDMDNDGDQELLVGDLSFSNINLLTNGGNAATAFFVQQEIFFPQNSTPIRLDIFPAAFYEDVNNDGKKDLLVAPNIEGNAQNAKVLFYENTGTATQPVFNYQTDGFLVDDMIDLGTNAFPTFVDINGDNLLDLVVGNYYEFVRTGVLRSQLRYYQNIGTSQQARYRLIEPNLGNLLQYNFLRIAPTFGDIDGDGDQDMLVGLEDGKLILLTNQGTTTIANFGNLSPNYASIDVGQNAMPQLVDVDRDGDLDLLIGSRTGNTQYYENTGTTTVASFSSSPTVLTFGNVDTRTLGQFYGNAAPRLIDEGGSYYFYVGNQTGELWKYSNVDNNLTGNFTKVSSYLDHIKEGELTAPALADINGDGHLDYLLGNKRGGLTAYTDPVVATRLLPSSRASILKIYPNPAKHSIKITLEHVSNNNIHWQVYNLQGQLLDQKQTLSTAVLDLKIMDYPAGTYLLKATIEQQIHTQLFIKK